MNQLNIWLDGQSLYLKDQMLLLQKLIWYNDLQSTVVFIPSCCITELSNY